MWGGWNMNSPEATNKCFCYDGFNGQMGMRTSEEEEEVEESERSNAFYKDVPGNDEDVHRASSSNNSVGSSSMYGGSEFPCSIVMTCLRR
ncbi:hypothetical protein YC2023_012864 [Brassica napus]